MKHFIGWVVLMVMPLFFVTCSEDDFGNTENKLSGKVGFDVNVQEVMTMEMSRSGESLADPIRTLQFKNSEHPMYARSVTVNAIDRNATRLQDSGTRGFMRSSDLFYDSFGLLLYDYYSGSNWTAEEPTITPEIYNEEVKRERGWMTQEYWPGNSHKLTFYAYAPYNDPNMTLSSNTQTGVPSLSYSVPLNCHDQQDLLICHDEKDVAGDYNATYGVTFDHVFAAIRFAVGDKMAACHITRIELRNIYGEGDYTFGDAAWTNVATKKTFYLDQDFEIKKTDKNRILTNGNNVFLMIPQILPDDAILAITVNDGSDHVLEMELKGEEWKMGTTKTYYISTSATDGMYVLSVTKPDDISASGEEHLKYTISSYYQTFYGSQNAVPWVAEYTVGGKTYSEADDIVYSFVNNGPGGNLGTIYEMSVDWAVPRSTRDNPHTAALQDATPLGSQANPYDLSAGKQTANCYVVNAPGTYSFPLVYGNARNADGSANVEAYGQDPNYPSTSFVDHANKVIDSPYIYETNGGANVPNNVCILWQDAPTLIRPDSLRLSENMDSVIFEVDQRYICQGNSVIAVRNSSNQILWSWHIWVTDEDISTANVVPFINNTGTFTSHLTVKPLGYCDADYRVTSEREFTLTITQDVTGGSTASVTFKQEGDEYELGQNSPLWQWGRKDPQLCSNGIGDNGFKRFYDYWYTPTQTWGQATNMGIATQNAYRFYYYGNTDWVKVSRSDYWNVGNSSGTINNERVIKSVYDPCPSGFCMPRTSAFTNLSTNSNGSYNAADFNVIGSFNYGWNFKTGYTSPQTLYFPALGYQRNEQAHKGKIQYVRQGGWLWTAGAYYTSNNSTLYAVSAGYEYNYVYGSLWDTKSLGFCVWPALDE